MTGDGLLHAIVAAEAVGGHRLRLRFDDGLEGEVDLRKVIPEFKNLLAPLADPAYVARVRVNVESGTVTWPNGADLDEVVLYCAVRGIPVPVYEDAPVRRTSKASKVVTRNPRVGKKVRNRKTEA